MTNHYDIEVRSLREHCEKLLQEMEEHCNEIDRILLGGGTEFVRLVCDKPGIDNVNGYSTQDSKLKGG